MTEQLENLWLSLVTNLVTRLNNEINTGKVSVDQQIEILHLFLSYFASLQKTIGVGGGEKQQK